MAELRWIMTSSLVMLQVLSCTVTSVETLSVTDRDKDEVTFPCESKIHDQKKCDGTTWLFSTSGSTVTLFELGKFKEGANNRLDRLNVTEECSLVIKKVKGQDAGQYICRQFESGQQRQDVQYHLSVVTMTEEEEGDEVKLKCSVWTDGRCGHTVKWLKEGSHTEVMTSHVCSASFSIKKDHYESLTCEVIDSQSGESHQFPFRRPQSGAFVTKTTYKPPVNETPEKTTIKSPPEDKKPVTAADDATKTTTKAKAWWWSLVYVSVGGAALVAITLGVVAWRRTKGNKTKTDDDADDPEGGVAYASVSFTKNTAGRAQAGLHPDEEEEGGAVTYTTLKPPRPSAAADPADLYATVTKPAR